MSRRPSPAPVPPNNPLPPPQPVARGKQKAFPAPINAGADDVKYQAKYKELKRKLRDIEADNDKLVTKVMTAKLTIQRMKMERAILYERLSVPPGSPSIHERAPLPVAPAAAAPPNHQAPAAPHHRRDAHEHPPPSGDVDQPFPAYQEYNSAARGTSNHLQPLHGRPGSAMDTAPSPGVAPSPHMSGLHSPSHLSPPEHDPRQQRAPLARPAMGAPYESRSHSSSHTSPPMDHDYPPPPHHIRTRSQSSSSRSRSHQIQPSTYHEGQYPEMQSQPFSPPLSEQERARHSDMRSIPPQPEPHAHPLHQPHSAQLSPQSSTSDMRSRMHPHQRVGPGTYINRDEQWQRDLDREREWEQQQASRERDRHREYEQYEMPPSSRNRARRPMDRTDYPDHHMSSARDEQPPAHYYPDGPPSRSYPHVSRSGTPGSASGSGAGHNEESSRPDSRAAQYYEQDRARTSNYRLRPVPGSGEEIDFVHEDGRAHSRTDRAPSGGGNFSVPDQPLPVAESRKRNRNEMDVDSDNDVADSSRGTGLGYSAGGSHPTEDRGSKRYHRERSHRRSMDALEDNRVGPS